MQKFGIGQPVPRVEDPRFITGRGRYVDDFDLPHQCYGVVVMSPHAHARIKKIDTAKAKAADGVLAVLTGADVEADGLGPLAPPMPQDMGGPPGFRTLRPILEGKKVRAIGERVAFVVAEDDQSGAQRRRTGRDRLRAAAGGDRRRRRGEAGRAGLVGRGAEQHFVHAGDGQQGRRPTRPSPRPSTSSSSSSTMRVSAPIRSSRAPRSANIIPRATITRSTRPRRTRTARARPLPARC